MHGGNGIPKSFKASPVKASQDWGVVSICIK
jgi:hypothetical protein